MDIDRAELVRLFLWIPRSIWLVWRLDALALEERPEGGENIDAMFRVAHTLKGNASILALDGFSKFSHILEDLLDAVRTRRTPVSSHLVTLLLRSVDALRAMLATLRAGEPEDPARYQGLREELAARAALAKPDEKHDEKHEDRSEEPARTDDEGGPTSPADGRPVLADESWGPALRIEMKRIDQLLNLASRALVVQGQMGTGLIAGATPTADLVELHQRSERLLIELQDWVIDTRMVPVSTFFRTHARTVRDAARAQHKRVRLRIEGERVRVDTGIGESARDVLTHLVRNAVDHGIEPPSVRVSRGKHPEGTVTLRAAQNGNQVVIQVADDGAGLNLAKIRARARSIGRANVDSMGMQELHQLIFEPGFSTAEKVTELSGRGVGMDVVRRNVETLHGTVEIESADGLGHDDRAPPPAQPLGHRGVLGRRERHRLRAAARRGGRVPRPWSRTASGPRRAPQPARRAGRLREPARSAGGGAGSRARPGGSSWSVTGGATSRWAWTRSTASGRR